PPPIAHRWPSGPAVSVCALPFAWTPETGPLVLFAVELGETDPSWPLSVVNHTSPPANATASGWVCENELGTVHAFPVVLNRSLGLICAWAISLPAWSGR